MAEESWMQADAAAELFDHTVVNSVYLLARKENWRRRRVGRRLEFATADVLATRRRRDQAR